MQINIKDLRCLNFVMPLAQQRETIDRAEHLHERSKKLRTAYVEKIDHLANLLQSLLQKAGSFEVPMSEQVPVKLTDLEEALLFVDAGNGFDTSA
jgi:hypothetical protein